MNLNEIARELMLCRDTLIKAQQVTGRQMLALWNPDEGRYENPELMGALHSIANQHLIAVSIVDELIDEIKGCGLLTVPAK